MLSGSFGIAIECSNDQETCKEQDGCWRISVDGMHLLVVFRFNLRDQ